MTLHSISEQIIDTESKKSSSSSLILGLCCMQLIDSRFVDLLVDLLV